MIFIPNIYNNDTLTIIKSIFVLEYLI